MRQSMTKTEATLTSTAAAPNYERWTRFKMVLLLR